MYSPCDECNAMLEMLGKMKAAGTSFTLHIDLHEVVCVSYSCTVAETLNPKP